jgi:hypothetical protein
MGAYHGWSLATRPRTTVHSRPAPRRPLTLVAGRRDVKQPTLALVVVPNGRHDERTRP